jgi:glutaredoxin
VKRVTLYTRRGCHLCERVEGLLRRARRQADFEIEFVDVDKTDDLKQRYGEQVPVVAIDGEELFGHAMEMEAFLKQVSS